ncbi:MerR family transcriptional regulator [Paenibacillus donghaensis]|nr:MerR family transcriptional regulator [Paenibacillus donghaensis]
MRISEAAQLCGITKKAINYYEQQGLLALAADESGYREFGEQEVRTLKEITLLRRLGMSVAEVKAVLESDDQHQALMNYRAIKEAQVRQVQAEREALNYLLESGSSLEAAFAPLEQILDQHARIKDKLLLAFPGDFGKYLRLHFGRFLNERLDSAEKLAAYSAVVEFLDRTAELQFPAELQQYFAEAGGPASEEHQEAINLDYLAAIKDAPSFIQAHRRELEPYLEYRSSAEYKETPAYRMRQLLLEFQQSSGYYDIFVANLQILSSSYREFQQQLQKANQQLLAEFPEAAGLFES